MFMDKNGRQEAYRKDIEKYMPAPAKGTKIQTAFGEFEVMSFHGYQNMPDGSRNTTIAKDLKMLQTDPKHSGFIWDIYEYAPGHEVIIRQKRG